MLSFPACREPSRYLAPIPAASAQIPASLPCTAPDRFHTTSPSAGHGGHRPAHRTTICHRELQSRCCRYGVGRGALRVRAESISESSSARSGIKRSRSDPSQSEFHHILLPWRSERSSSRCRIALAMAFVPGCTRDVIGKVLTGARAAIGPTVSNVGELFLSRSGSFC